MPVIVPESVELKYLDSAGNLQSLPALLLEGQEAPKHLAVVVYKKADGSLGVSQLDVLLAAIRDRLPSGGSASEATLSQLKTAVDALNAAVSTAARQDAEKAVLDAIKTALDALNATQGAAKTVLDAIAAKDFATQATLAALKTAFDERDIASAAKQDEAKAVLDTLSKEATLELVRVLLVSLDGKAATAAKQDTLKTAVDLLATEAKLEAVRLLLASLDGKLPALVADRVPVDGSGVTQPVSAAALPLPTGAATQATLATIEGKDFALQGAPITGQSLEAGGSGLSGWLASIRKAITDRLPGALVGGRLDTNLGAIGGTAPSTNSGTKDAGTLRVVLATDQPSLSNPQPIKQASSDQPILTYGTPTQVPVGSTAADIVESTTGFRKVVIRVALDAVVGVYVNPNGTATSSHLLLGPGDVLTLHTAQAVSAIRAGSSNVTVYVQTAV